MAYNMLLAITNVRDSWKMKVRVIRLRDPINLNNNEHLSLDMIVLDEEVSSFVKEYGFTYRSNPFFLSNDGI